MEGLGKLLELQDERIKDLQLTVCQLIERNAKLENEINGMRARKMMGYSFCCAICDKDIREKLPNSFPDDELLYCDECFEKAQRKRGWLK